MTKISKVQNRILSLAKQLGGVTQFEILARQIPMTAFDALIKKGHLISNVGSNIYYLNTNPE